MHVYFMGICGTAMGNAALMLKAGGHQVSGADTGIYPPMSEQLAQGGIAVLEGWDVGRLQALAPDLVVVGNVISRGNPEIEWLLDSRALPFTSLPALLGEQVIGSRPALVVAGTHGKTTTSTLAAHLLRASGAEPGWLIGGIPRDLPTGAHRGPEHSPFVIEGDEYDSAFFDKRSKFIHYRPRILALNNLEFDHGDIFRDLTDIERSFSHLTRLVPRSGAIVYNGDDDNLTRLLPVSWCPCLSVGQSAGCDLRILDFRESRTEGTSFTLLWQNTRTYTVRWPLPALYNARNAAMAALAAGLLLDRDQPLDAVNLAALTDFRGVRRRQEILHEDQHLTVIEDFGHHPSAIAGTLGSLRSRYPDHQLVACLEPRSNTACTRVFQQDFEDALASADITLLSPVHRGERYRDDERLDTSALAHGLRQRGLQAQPCTSHDDLLQHLLDLPPPTAQPRCVIFFSNGSFGGIMPRYVKWLKG